MRLFSVGKTFLKPKVVEEKVFVKRKPRRPDRLGKLPKCRPQSAPSFRPKSAASEKVQDKGSKAEPFMNYGGGAVDRSLGDKKTFNVRASSAVRDPLCIQIIITHDICFWNMTDPLCLLNEP